MSNNVLHKHTNVHSHSFVLFSNCFSFFGASKMRIKTERKEETIKNKTNECVCVRSRVCVKDYWPHFGEDFWPHYGLCLLLMGNEYNEHNTVSYAATTDPYICPYEINSLPRPYRESMI